MTSARASSPTEWRPTLLHGAPPLARTFTLREVAELMEKVRPEIACSRPDLRSRFQALVAEMAASRAHRQSASDSDVTDPVNRLLEVQEEVGVLIAETLLPVLRRIALLVADSSD